MNRFKIVKGKEIEFENVWKNRDTHLANVPGFKTFNLVKGDKKMSILYMHHIVFGIQKKIFGTGLSLRHLSLLTKMLGNIKIYILVLLILKVLKKCYKSTNLNLTQQTPN